MAYRRQSPGCYCLGWDSCIDPGTGELGHRQTLLTPHRGSKLIICHQLRDRGRCCLAPSSPSFSNSCISPGFFVQCFALHVFGFGLGRNWFTMGDRGVWQSSLWLHQLGSLWWASLIKQWHMGHTATAWYWHPPRLSWLYFAAETLRCMQPCIPMNFHLSRWIDFYFDCLCLKRYVHVHDHDHLSNTGSSILMVRKFLLITLKICFLVTS